MELKDFTYSLTYSTTPFEKFNVPSFHRMTLPSLRIPLHIEFNKTYYMMMNDKLQAFRIIGISIAQLNSKDTICYLIQKPNESIKWVADFITTNSVIFENKDDMFEFINGNTRLNVNNTNNLKWKEICYLLSNVYVEELGYKVRFSKGQIYNDWYWDNSSQQPKTSLTYISYLFITKGNVQIGLKNCDKHYKSKEDCIKAHFNDYYIDDFEEEPFIIELEVLPNTLKKYVLKFEQE
jgi:hypothetical protein